MAYVIVDGCLKDVLCVDACPTDSIHPKAEDEKFASVDQLYINPAECIDCGACVAACPTGSILAVEELPAEKAEYVEKNAAYFA
jgi:NAD-dependent dihydropyrimidine dehydrogenase PreA subunit